MSQVKFATPTNSSLSDLCEGYYNSDQGVIANLCKLDNLKKIDMYAIVP